MYWFGPLERDKGLYMGCALGEEVEDSDRDRKVPIRAALDTLYTREGVCGGSEGG